MCIAVPNIDHVAFQERSEVSPERRIAHNNQDREITSSRPVDAFKLDWLVLSSALHECSFPFSEEPSNEMLVEPISRIHFLFCNTIGDKILFFLVYCLFSCVQIHLRRLEALRPLEYFMAEDHREVDWYS